MSNLIGSARFGPRKKSKRLSQSFKRFSFKFNPVLFDFTPLWLDSLSEIGQK